MAIATAVKSPFEVITHSAVQYEVRHELLNGVMNTVIPIAIMVEGVHAGSQGPILHLAEDLKKFTKAWNGIPVSLGHPTTNGTPVSCNETPERLAAECIGRIFNTRWDGKLRAEAWLPENELGSISPELVQALNEGRAIEVSCGVFSDYETTQGNFHGEKYTAIARNHRPDHLAILLDCAGACSVADGCGVRTNAEGGDTEMKIKSSLVLINTKADVEHEIVLNAIGHRELAAAIQTQLDTFDNSMRVHYLLEVFNGKFIYKVEPSQPGSPSQMFQQEYTVDKSNNSVEFDGDPKQVVKKVDYAVMAASTEGGGTEMAVTKENCPKCFEAAEALAANKASEFGTDDIQVLAEMAKSRGVEFLDKFIPKAEKPEKVATNVKPDTKKPDTKKSDNKPSGDEVQMNEAQAVAIVEKILEKNPEKVFGYLPAAYRDVLERGKDNAEAERAELEAIIIANERNKFTPEALKAKSFAEIGMLAALAGEAPADYSGQGQPPARRTAQGPKMPAGQAPVSMRKDEGK